MILIKILKYIPICYNFLIISLVYLFVVGYTPEFDKLHYLFIVIKLQ